MNIKTNMKSLPVLTLALGLLTCALRLALLLLSRDEKGLLIVGHPLNILTWVVTAAAAVMVILCVWKLDGSRKYEHNFGADTGAAAGCFVLAAGIAATVVFGWSTRTKLELVCNMSGLLAVPAMIGAGLNRQRGNRPFFAFHGLTCLYLTLYAIGHYQIWCSRPQMQNWFFNMAAILLLAMFAYYQTAFDEDMGSRRMQLATGLLAAFFCAAAAANAETVWLYLCGAIWAATNLCALVPVKRRRRNPITEAPQEDTK